MNAVEKALGILSALADAEYEPMTVTNLAQALNINRSTCSHIVKTLTEHGYAERISHKDGYTLGPEAYYLSRFGKYEESLINTCLPVMKWLYNTTGHVAGLAAIKNNQKFLLHTIDFKNEVYKKRQRIYRDDTYRTATGRIILANMSKEDLRTFYDTNGTPDKKIWPEVDSFEALTKELSKLKKRGSVTITKHSFPELGFTSYGYGGAIFKNSTCVGAVGIAYNMPLSGDEVDQKYHDEIIKSLKLAMAEINRRLKYK